MLDPKQLWPSFTSPFVRHFADDGTGDKGGSGTGGTEKGSDDGKTTNEGDKNKPDEFVVKIDGEERKVTLEELTQMASRSGGADKRFREAAESLKKSEKWETVGRLFTKISNPENTPAKDDIAQLAALLELNPADLKTFLDEDDGNNKNGGNKQTKQSAGEKKGIAIEDLPDEIQQVLQGAKKSQIDAAIAEVKNDVKEAIDKDEILGKIIIDSGDTQGLKNALSEMIFEDVQRRIALAGEQYGPELIKSSIQKARARMGKFSTHNQKEDGLNLGILGLGPSGKLPDEVQADKPIERISSTEVGYEDNFLKRFQQGLLKAVRSKRQ